MQSTTTQRAPINIGPRSININDVKKKRNQRNWDIFQMKVTLSEKEETINGSIKNKINWIKDVLEYPKKLEKVSEEQENEPTAYFETVKKLRKFIKDIIYVKVNDHTSEINRLDPNLYTATEILIDTFDSIFQIYFKEQNYDKAFESIKKISSTQQGWKGLLSLATVYLNQNNPKISDVLNILKNCFPEEITIFLNRTETKQIPILISFTKKINNEYVKKLILTPTIIKYFNEENPDYLDLINHIKNDLQKKEICTEIVNLLLNKNKWDEALPIISIIKEDYTRNSFYTKIIDSYFVENNIPKALEIVSKLSNDSNQEEYFKKSFNIYFEEENIENALNIINKIKQPYYQKQFYEKIIDYYFEKNNIPRALEIVPKLCDNINERKYFEKAFNIYFEREDVENALVIIPMIKPDYYQKQLYKKIIEFYLCQNNFSKTIEVVNKIKKENQKDFYINIIDFCLENKIEGAEVVIPLIPDKYTQDQQRKRFTYQQ